MEYISDKCVATKSYLGALFHQRPWHTHSISLIVPFPAERRYASARLIIVLRVCSLKIKNCESIFATSLLSSTLQPSPPSRILKLLLGTHNHPMQSPRGGYPRRPLECRDFSLSLSPSFGRPSKVVSAKSTVKSGPSDMDISGFPAYDSVACAVGTNSKQFIREILGDPIRSRSQ